MSNEWGWGWVVIVVTINHQGHIIIMSIVRIRTRISCHCLLLSIVRVRVSCHCHLLWARGWGQVLIIVHHCPSLSPMMGISVGYEQGGRAKVRATQATAQCTQWCALYCHFCSSQGGDGMAGALSSLGHIASHCLRCEDEVGVLLLSSEQQGCIIIIVLSSASPVVIWGVRMRCGYHCCLWTRETERRR